MLDLWDTVQLGWWVLLLVDLGVSHFCAVFGGLTKDLEFLNC